MTLEDIQLLMALTPEQARDIEPLLHQQARSDLRFLTHNVPSSDMTVSASRRTRNRLHYSQH